MGLSLAAFCLTTALIVIIFFEVYTPGGPKPYMPKKHQSPKSLWIKSLLKALNWCTMVTTKLIINSRVRHMYQPQHPRICGRCQQQRKQQRASFTTVTCMTSTWGNGWSTPCAREKQFDSDFHALMLDDGVIRFYRSYPCFR